jgi:predicted short-subunit dehydrogenase-like oxidoreductase (DUF2520 family)
MSDRETREIRVGIVGVGAVGSVLARALAHAGVDVVAVASRRPERAAYVAASLPRKVEALSPQDVVEQTDLVFLTVPDDAIQQICESLRWRQNVAVVHCSGALSTSVLAAAAEAGAETGSCHPFQPFTLDGTPDDHLVGCMFGIEANEPLRALLGNLVERVGGWPLFLESDGKASYHMAAVFASNYVVALAAAAVDLLRALGTSPDDAMRGVLPILRGTLDNLKRQGVPHGLTGPIARGDSGTIALHLQVLAERHPELLPAYIELGRLTVPVARARGTLSDPAAASLLALFDRYDER